MPWTTLPMPDAGADVEALAAEMDDNLESCDLDA
jgi:hypothetical protein